MWIWSVFIPFHIARMVGVDAFRCCFSHHQTASILDRLLTLMAFASYFVFLRMHYLQPPSFFNCVHVCFCEEGKVTKCHFDFEFWWKIKMPQMWHLIFFWLHASVIRPPLSSVIRLQWGSIRWDLSFARLVWNRYLNHFLFCIWDCDQTDCSIFIAN